MRHGCDGTDRHRVPRNSLIALVRGPGTVGEVLVVMMTNMTRLESIATRQRRSRIRDLVFAALIVFAGTISLIGVTQAVRAAAVTHVVPR